MASGARMTVTVAPLSGEAKSLRLRAGATLRQALLSAGYDEGDLSGMLASVRVNNQRKGLDARLPAGAFVTIAPDVQGGGL